MRAREIVLMAALAFAPTNAHAQNAQTTAALTQQKADAALRVLNLALAHYQQGLVNADEIGTWASRWYHAKRETVGPTAQVAVAQEWVDKMRTFEQLAKARVQMGAASTLDAEKAAFYRIEAELTLAKLKTP